MTYMQAYSYDWEVILDDSPVKIKMKDKMVVIQVGTI